MAPLLQLSRRALPRPSRLKSLTNRPRSPPLHRRVLHWTTSSVAETRRSTVHDHLCRLLRSEIVYEMRTRPPRELVKELDSFVVEERPGEQWVRLTKRHGAEEITVDATMFDGFVTKGEDSDVYGKLRISLVVDVKKGGKCNGVLQFLCSAWPDALVVKRISVLKHNSVSSSPYMGPKFRDLDEEFRKVMLAFLQERSIDDDFAGVLHDYMSNKDRSEVIRWMKNVKVFIEKNLIHTINNFSMQKLADVKLYSLSSTPLSPSLNDFFISSSRAEKMGPKQTAPSDLVVCL